MEVYVLVPVRRSFLNLVLGSLCLALAIVLLLAACTIPIVAYGAVLLALAWYYISFKFGKEYEYAYFDREVRLARIINKSRRKSLGTYSMEDVEIVAPAGNRAVQRYEQMQGIKVLDYTSHNKGTPYYEMVVRKDGETILLKMELDDRYLDEVEKQYQQKVIRANVDFG